MSPVALIVIFQEETHSPFLDTFYNVLQGFEILQDNSTIITLQFLLNKNYSTYT